MKQKWWAIYIPLGDLYLNLCLHYECNIGGPSSILSSKDACLKVALLFANGFSIGFSCNPNWIYFLSICTSPVKKQPAGREAPCLLLPAPQSLAQQTPRPWEARHPREAPLESPQESPENWFDIIHLSSGHLQAWIEIWEMLWSCKQFLQVGIGWGHQEVKVSQGGLCSRPLNILLLWMGSI